MNGAGARRYARAMQIAAGNELRGRVAIVTGGATGIGFASARRLASMGATVVIAGRNRPRGEAAAHTLVASGYQVAYAPTDVRCETQVHGLMESTARAYGGIDIVFNNAGVEGTRSPLETFSNAMVDDLLDTNFKGVFWGMKHAMPHLAARRGGIIVNTASFVGTVKDLPCAAVYGATKAAIVSMTRTMAVAGAAERVRIFAVCPWITDTPMVDRLAGDSDETRQEMVAMNPSGQLVDPADVALVVAGLCAGTLAYPSGEALLVDCGGTARPLARP